MTSASYNSNSGGNVGIVFNQFVASWLNCCVNGETTPSKPKRLDATMIGAPSNFVHIGHVGSAEKGSLAELNGLERQMRSKGGYGVQMVPLAHLRLMDLPANRSSFIETQRTADLDGDGVVTQEDFQLATEKICRMNRWAIDSQKALECKQLHDDIWNSLQLTADIDKDGKINSLEWLKMWTNMLKGVSCPSVDNLPMWVHRYLVNRFQLLDRTGDGVIDQEEFEYVMSEFNVPPGDCRKAWLIVSQRRLVGEAARDGPPADAQFALVSAGVSAASPPPHRCFRPALGHAHRSRSLTSRPPVRQQPPPAAAGGRQPAKTASSSIFASLFSRGQQQHAEHGRPTTAREPKTSADVGDPPRQTFMEARLPRFPLKKLRYKQQSFVDQPTWKSVDYCSWISSSGSYVRLRGARLERLAAVERQALQKLAFVHLQKANLGCAILRPKDSLPLRQKRHKYIKRKAHTVNVVDKKDALSSGSPPTSILGSRKSPTPHAGSQQVFGIPLSQCIENDQQWARGQQLHDGVSRVSPLASTATGPSVVVKGDSQQQQQQQQKSSGSSASGQSASASASHQLQLSDEQKHARCQSLDLDEMEFLNVARISPQRLSGESSKSSLSDQASSDSLLIRPTNSKGSLNNQTTVDELPSTSDRRYASSDSLLGSVSCQNSPRSTSATAAFLYKEDSCVPHCPRVPRVVRACTEFLSQRGLQTIGLFRVAGSAKRCRQLRLELDSGQEVVLNEEQPEIYPHDIATLLKEYFRDLPDPLLTKELYAPFLATARFSEETRIELLRDLISLLPVANSDTLLVLLHFLRKVASHSYDTINDQGVSMSGNKMNAHNLATVFGPTILRPGTAKAHQSLNDTEAVIRVMETMIEHCGDIFDLPRALQDSLFRTLADTDPDALDLILTRLSIENDQNEEQPDQPQATVYFSSQEELDPPAVSKDSDGTTVVRTRQKTTHRITYKLCKPGGRFSSSLSSYDEPSRTAALVNERFPELSLFAEDEDEESRLADEPPELVDLASGNAAAVLVGSPSTNRATALSTLAKPPARKLTPLAKLTEAIRPKFSS